MLVFLNFTKSMWLVEEIEENLLRARHRFRDLQQQAGACGLSNGDVVSTKESHRTFETWQVDEHVSALLVATNCKNKWVDWRQHCAFLLLCPYRFAPLEDLEANSNIDCATDWLFKSICWTEPAEFATFWTLWTWGKKVQVQLRHFFRIAHRCIYNAEMRTSECQVLDPGLAVLTGGSQSKGMDLSPGRIVSTLQHFCLYT